MRGLSERWKRARTSEDFAWACLVTNALGVPGMGTLMARRWEAWPQLALATAGGVLMTWWIAGFVIAELRTMTVPPPGAPPLARGVWGILLFVAGWLWALASSVIVLRAARRGPSTESGR